MNAGNIDLSIVIPFYNEEGNIGQVYHALANSFEGTGVKYEIIMVDNGSKDNTGRNIDRLIRSKKHVRKIRVEKNQGYGFGVLNGLHAAGGKHIGYIDGDDPTCAAYAVKLYFKSVNEGLDICRGIRTVRGDRLNRKVASNFYNALFDLFFLSGIHDVNGKPKIIKKEVFNDLNIKSKDWFIDSEILIKAMKKKYSLGSIPVIAQKRVAGFSYVKPRTVLEFMKNLLRFRRELWTSQKS